MANWEFGFGLDVGNLTSGILNYYSQKETNKANRELAELAYQQNVEQWERENSYNHPKAQMERLQQAGLNPNLVYGNGSAVQTSAHSPQMSYPHMQAPQMNISTPMRASRSPLIESQEVVNNSIAELNTAKAVEAIASAKGIDAKTKHQLIVNLFASQRQEAELLKLQKEIDHFDKQWEVFASQVDVNRSIVELNKEEKNKVLEEIKKLGMDIKQAESLYEYWYSKGLTPASGWNQLMSQLAWRGLQLPADGAAEINIFTDDEEFENKHGFKKYSPEWWAMALDQLEIKSFGGRSSNL